MRAVFGVLLGVATVVPTVVPAVAQTGVRPRAFTEADYPAFFSSGVLPYVSGERQGVLQFTRNDGHRMLRQIEAHPRWDTTSLYPYIKFVSFGREQLGRWDRKLGAQTYTANEDDLEIIKNSIVWLSRNNRPEVSPDDVRIGTLWGYYATLAKKRRVPMKEFEVWFREEMLGGWSMRCDFVQSENYEAECVHTHMTDGSQQTRRYLKSPGMG